MNKTKDKAYWEKPYGGKVHRRRYGDGICRFRNGACAQPRALRKGDILATGERVVAIVPESFPGMVVLVLDYKGKSIQTAAPAMLPIALARKGAKA